METVRNLTQAYSQAPWRKQIAFIGLFLLLVVFLALVAGIYLDVTARTATMGREIQFMQREIDEHKLVNADLETQLALLTSAEVMEQRAQVLGFEPIALGQQEFLFVQGYLPPRQIVLAPPPVPVQVQAAALPTAYTASLFDWFARDVLPELKKVLEVRK
jgi:cell division protein FtsL